MPPWLQDGLRAALRLATVDITPLRRHRDFRLLTGWRLISFFGGMITYTAVPYQVYQLTHSVIALLPHPQVWLMFVIVGVAASLDALQRPALGAILPRIVDREELLAAGAIGTLTMNMAMMAGPAAAGLLIAFVGLPITYGVNLATFVFGLLCLWALRA